MPERLGDDEILAALGSMDDAEILNIVQVEGASGTRFSVIGDEEAGWFNTNLARYLDQYAFENIADMQDLDRLLALELLSYRYAVFLIRGSDYEDQLFDEKAVRDHKEKIDREIRQIKEHMGMGRKNRLEEDRQSAADYLRDLLSRAKEFGIHRDHQIAKAIDVLMEIKKLIGLYDRCDEEERIQLGVTPDQILQWLREVAIPEYDLLDENFRSNQKLWIREVS